MTDQIPVTKVAKKPTSSSLDHDIAKPEKFKAVGMLNRIVR